MCGIKTNILFVCMGNICRSPAAESFFRLAVEEVEIDNQFLIESAGTGGWHAGSQPDRRMKNAAKKQGLAIHGTARQITVKDLSTFDWIFCMDQDNFDDVISMGGDPEKVKDKTSLNPYIKDVPLSTLDVRYVNDIDAFMWKIKEPYTPTEL